MEALKAWGTTVCIAALAAGIAGIIAPSGKMEKVYKFAVSLFFLCCLLVPLFSLKNITPDSISLSQTGSMSNAALSSAVKEQAASVAQQNVASLVDNCCRSKGVVPVKIRVQIAFAGSSSKMSVSLVRVVLKSSDMPKQAEITDTIKNKLGIDVKIKEGGI